jgi:NADP-dependent 3-hydroxy acid dehydrogenase YdfG
VVVIGGSSGIGLAAARLAREEGAEVTIAGRSQKKLVQAQQELGQVHTVVTDITDDGGVEKVFAGLSRVDHVLISAGTLRQPHGLQKFLYQHFAWVRWFSMGRHSDHGCHCSMTMAMN